MNKDGSSNNLTPIKEEDADDLNEERKDNNTRKLI